MQTYCSVTSALRVMRQMNAALFMSLFLFVSACSGGGDGGGKNNSNPQFSLGGTVSGLTGTGLILSNNSVGNISITQNGSYIISAQVAQNSSYNVTVVTQPSNPTQNCTVVNGSGVVITSVTNINVSCVNTYTIGGTVSGLKGSGMVLQANGGNNLGINQNGPFTFSLSVNAGANYAVSVSTQPTNPSQICALSNASGTANANVTNVSVTCVDAYPIGGTVNGLTSSGLVLQNNGNDNLTITQNGTFSFSGLLTSGSTYKVAVLTQPGGSTGACLVSNGSGVANDRVTNIHVNCGFHWTWKSGSSATNQSGAYGTLAVASPNNRPGSRRGSATWVDASGNLWLYGGGGYDSTGATTTLADLWKYSPANSEWTWISGPNSGKTLSVYGVKGQSNAANTPGGRALAMTWVDRSGDFWLFGGFGYTDVGCPSTIPCAGEFNDLWKYSSANGEWTWVNGPNVPNTVGSYGTKGIALSSNLPNPRDSASSWADASGNLWMFGGATYIGNSSLIGNMYNDLWEYSPTSNQWTWVGGSNQPSQAGNCGTKGTTAASNVPGARSNAFTGLDSNGTVWIFGGFGNDCQSSGFDYQAELNDLWKYGSGEWTWVAGSSIHGQVANYGSLGQPAASNDPGGRDDGAAWVDNSGNFWLYGGEALNASSGKYEARGDVWKYGNGQWTWMSGSSLFSQQAAYDSLGNPGDPGGRIEFPSWADKFGNLWVFGGGTPGYRGVPPVSFTDLWEYVP